MKEEKTILEWLKELPDGYRELALGRGYGELPQLPKETGSGWREMIDALIETDKDLRILKNQLISAAKSNHRFEGMDSVVEGWIQRGRDALRKAGVELEEVG